MSMGISGASRADRGLTNWECRARRLARERAALAEKLQDLLVEIPDAVSFDFHDLRHLAGYRTLEQEGLVHAGIWRISGRLTILAASGRVLKRPDLRLRVFALRRLAETEFKRIVIAGPRGIVNETIRLRARRAAGLVVAPER